MNVPITYTQRVVRILLLIVVVLTPSEIFGQAFETGYQAFLSGDYKRAKVFLSRGIDQTSDRYDKALMHKLLGITEFKLGSKQRAQANFQKSLQLDPAIRITREESRDKSVLQLFSSAQKSSAPRASSSSSSRPRAEPARRTGRSSARQNSRQQRPQSSAAQRGGSKQRQATEEVTDGGSLLVNLLPFGLGQFQQGKTLLGASFALGQLFGLGLFVERTLTANQADQDALDVIKAFEAGGDIGQEEFSSYLSQNESFVKGMRSEATIGILLFSGLYVASVLEALLNPPTVVVPRAGRRRAALEEANKMLLPGEELDGLYLAEQRHNQDQRMFRFHLDWQRGQPRGILSLKLELD